VLPSAADGIHHPDLGGRLGGRLVQGSLVVLLAACSSAWTAHRPGLLIRHLRGHQRVHGRQRTSR
jgi:hypothetical protein